MGAEIIRLDQFFEGKRIKIKGPTKREMMNMQH